ncbi:MAG: Chitinase A1 precursor [Pelotomaculum sp. PtaB.Bin013]|nr:MAG: Chitinase A1 precursor [Pelotomaculum sp. PtaB.Bin013]
MKKRLVVLSMVFLIVFATSGSALAKDKRGNQQQLNQSWLQNLNTVQHDKENDNEDNSQQIQVFFFDVPDNHWASKAIKNMRKLGVICGDPDGNFYPERTVTRAEFAKMLVLSLNLPLDQGTVQTFTDIPANFWGYKYIEAAQNYLTGYLNSNGQLSYQPQAPAVREDIIVALVKGLGLGSEQPDYSVLSNFVDADQISNNLKGYVAIAVKHNLVKGSLGLNGQYYLNPQGKLTRAEAAAFLDRIIQNNKVVVGDNQGDKVIIGQQPGTQQAPVLNTATVNGAILTLNYNESLDTNSVPSGSDFSVVVNGTVQAAPAGVTVSGSNVTIVMYQTVPAGSTVTLSYTPGTHPIRDLTGYNASALVNYQVSNGNATSDTTPPTWLQSSVLSVSNLSGTGLTLTWPQATDNVGVTAYRIYENGSLLTTLNGATTTYNVTGLTAGTQYTFQVQAGDAAGNWSTSVSTSVTTTALTDTQAPAWPAGSALTASSVTQNSLTLTWPQATDNVGVTAYRIYENGSLLATVSGSVNSYNVVGLTANTAHTFRVDAGDAAGNWATGPSLNAATI